MSPRKIYLAAAAGAVIAALDYAVSSYLIASGLTAAERLDLEDSPADYGAEFEAVRFLSRRGDVVLDGWYMEGQGGKPVIVFVHGVSSTRCGGGMTELACILNRQGFGALLFDLRAHGLSEGERMSGGWHERLDVLGAIDFLSYRGVEVSRVGLLGISMGAATAALAAAEEPRIRALVMDSPYARASDLIAREGARATVFPEWMIPPFIPGAALIADALFDIKLEGLAPEEAVRRLGYPILVTFGTEDERIPQEQFLRVFSAAPKGSALWRVDGSEHCAAFLDHKSDYAAKVAEYFLSRLGGE